MVWPNGRPGGLFGVRGARSVWAALWLVMAWLWLVEASSSTNATSDAINAAPSGMSWLSNVQNWAAERRQGQRPPDRARARGAVGRDRRRGRRSTGARGSFSSLAIVLNLLYWVVGQGFGGIIQGGATDPTRACCSCCSCHVALVRPLHRRADASSQGPPAARTTGRERDAERAWRREVLADERPARTAAARAAAAITAVACCSAAARPPTRTPRHVGRRATAA